MASDFSINAEINANTQGYEAGIRKVQEASKNCSNVIKDLAKKVAGVFAVATISKAVSNIVTDFDKATSAIAKGTGATGKQLQEFSKNVAHSLKTGVGRSAEELGSMLADINTRFGITGEELNNLIDTFDKFANVTNTDVNESINATADLMKKWGVSIEDTQPLLDQLTKAGQISGISLNELNSTLTQGQTIFAEFGMGISDSIAYLSSLKQNGISTSVALAGMRTALVNFNSAGKDAREEFTSISEKIKNAKTDSEALSISIETFGNKAGAEMVKALRSGSSSIEDFREQLKYAGGTLNATDEASKTVADKIDELKASFSGLFLELSGSSSESLKNIIDDIKTFINTIDVESISSVINPVIDVIQIAFNFIKDVIISLSNAVQDLFNYMAENLKKNTSSFTSWSDSFYEILNSIYKYFQDTIYFISNLLKGNFSLAWDYAKLAAFRSVNAILSAISSLMNGFPNLVNGIINGINKIIGAINKVRSYLGQGEFSLLDPFSSINLSESTGIAQKIIELEQKIEKETGKKAEVELKALKARKAGVKEIESTTTATEIHITDVTVTEAEKRTSLLSKGIKTVEESVKNLKDKIVALFTPIKNVTINIAKAFKASFDKITSLASTMANAVIKISNTLWNGFKKAISINLDDSLVTLLQFEDSILTFIVDTIPRFQYFVTSALDSIIVMIDKINGYVDLSEVSTEFSETFAKISKEVITATEKIVELVTNAITLFANFIKNNASTIVETVGGIGLAILSKLPIITESLFSALNSFIDEFSKWFETNESTVISSVSDTINNIVNFIINLLSSDVLASIITSVGQIIADVITNIGEHAEDFGNALKNLVSSLTEALHISVIALVETLPSLIPELIDSAFDLFMGLFDVITDERFIDGVINSILALIESIIEYGLPAIIEASIKLMLLSVKSVFKAPSIIAGIITAIGSGFANADWGGMWNDIKQSWWSFWESLSNPMAKIANSMLDGLVEGFGDFVGFVKEVFSKFINAIKDFFGIHSPSTVFEELGRFMLEGLRRGFEVFEWVEDVCSIIYKSFLNLASLIEDIFSAIVDNIKDSISSAFNALTDNPVVDAITDNPVVDVIKSGLEKADDFIEDIPVVGSGYKAVKKFFGFATGTNNAPSGLSIVGEEGPELIDLHGGERIYNAHTTEKILSGMNGNQNNFNVTFNNVQDTSAFTMLQQLKRYNRQMAVAGVF